MIGSCAEDLFDDLLAVERAGRARAVDGDRPGRDREPESFARPVRVGGEEDVTRIGGGCRDDGQPFDAQAGEIASERARVRGERGGMRGVDDDP